jgi:hypothetical protein
MTNLHNTIVGTTLADRCRMGENRCNAAATTTSIDSGSRGATARAENCDFKADGIHQGSRRRQAAAGQGWHRWFAICSDFLIRLFTCCCCCCCCSMICNIFSVDCLSRRDEPSACFAADISTTATGNGRTNTKQGIRLTR